MLTKLLSQHLYNTYLLLTLETLKTAHLVLTGIGTSEISFSGQLYSYVLPEAHCNSKTSEKSVLTSPDLQRHVEVTPHTH